MNAPSTGAPMAFGIVSRWHWGRKLLDAARVILESSHSGHAIETPTHI